MDIPNTPISDFERREEPIAPFFPCNTTKSSSRFKPKHQALAALSNMAKIVKVRSLGSSSNTKVFLKRYNQVFDSNSTTARLPSQHVDYGIMRNAPANDKNGIRIRGEQMLNQKLSCPNPS